MSKAEQGAGKYDDLCTYVREESQAEGAFVVILNGVKGSGFSVQLTSRDLHRLPSILRSMADDIEAANTT